MEVDVCSSTSLEAFQLKTNHSDFTEVVIRIIRWKSLVVRQEY